MKISLTFFVSFIFLICFSCAQPSERINGVSLVNPPRPIDQNQMQEVARLNANWVAVIPFGFSRMGEPHVYFDSERQWWGERTDGCRVLISMAQKSGFEVMLKPHVWMRGGWIGDFDLATEEEWLVWERDYRRYILTYAEMAEEMTVGLFCVGTELRHATMRTAFWEALIDEVRAVYSGKLTYAANWDDYGMVSFWSKLDYIGIDGYFPLAQGADPTLKDIEAGWMPVKEKLETYTEKEERPILFTEYGYQSANGAAGNHWEVSASAENINLELQARAYRSLYESIWEEDWFAGGFLWKWHFREGAGGARDARFTPQNKPAEEVIKLHYGK